MRLEDWRQEGVGSISVAQGRKVGPSPESICRTPYHDYKREHSVTQWREGFKLWEEGTGDTLMQTGAGKWLVGNLLGDGDILKGCLLARVGRQASSKLEWQVWMWVFMEQIQIELFCFLTPLRCQNTPFHTQRSHGPDANSMELKMKTFYAYVQSCLEPNGRAVWTVCFKDQNAQSS